MLKNSQEKKLLKNEKFNIFDLESMEDEVEDY
jgi:hypothetical protein